MRIPSGGLAWIGAGYQRRIRTCGASAWTVVRIRNRCLSHGNAGDQIVWQTLMQLSSLSRTQPRIPIQKKTANRIATISAELAEWTGIASPASLAMRKGLLLQFLAVLRQDAILQKAFRTLVVSHKQLDLLQRVLGLIDREAVRLADVNDLADRAGVSRSGIYRLFHAAGFPGPSVMLDHARVELATRLLKETDQTVLSIAMETGFGSLSSFYRTFHRIHGQSPGQLRRSLPGS